MQATLDDLSTVALDDVLDDAERRLGRQLKREDGHFSKYNGTAGFRTDEATWVRIAWRRTAVIDSQAWTGYEAAAAIEGVPRPEWSAAAVWTDHARGVVWRADEMTLVEDGALSATGDITTDPGLPEQWWADLQTALTNLAAHSTDRVSMGQTHLTRRIHEVYGNEIDTTITNWACAHGDLGYANLCGPDLSIIDWESWGMGPAGWDAACLWSASLAVPTLAERVQAMFSDILSTRSGKLSRLLLCANVERAFRRTGKKAPLTDTMAELATSLVRELQ
ncbi:aminoglycoside phosphotransferase [Streptomyces sp. ME19-01-6]|uniref:aminoglycoside phosphotransferase n=1 Tax=Streptomyces sp. ME19-01-6 TaxID=3028686 RepID=UPI0029BBC1CE|nr:aminoglycoside phosphotransferase [Streptomyces sp. ME19-01-6]MDX3224529.1 aminoglycoside phosphotransferase [Streptomyces sp. ME19-01-6]